MNCCYFSQDVFFQDLALTLHLTYGMARNPIFDHATILSGSIQLPCADKNNIWWESNPGEQAHQADALSFTPLPRRLFAFITMKMID